MRKPHNPEGIVLTLKAINDGWSVLNEGDTAKAGDAFMMMSGEFTPVAGCSSEIGLPVDEVFPAITVFRCAKAGAEQPSLNTGTGTDRRRAILRRIESLVCSERPKTHGEAEENLKDLADLLNIQLKKKLKEPLTSKDAGMMMVLSKCARIIHDPTCDDHYHDGGGYFVCVAGINESEKGKQ